MNTVRCSNRLCEKEYNVQFDKCPFCGTPNPTEESERKPMMEKSKATDIRNSSSGESLFNGWVTGIIWVNIIFFGVREIIGSFTNMIFSPLIGCITLGLSIVGIISLLYILRAKKWAFFLWIAYRIAGAVVVSIINPKFSLTAHIIFAVVNILLMIAVLQIKKNGVSAWSVIFSKHKTSTRSKKAHHIIKRHNDTHNSELYKPETNVSNEPTDSIKVGETQCALKENVLSASISTLATNELQEEIPPTIMPNEQPIEKDVHNQSNEMSKKPRKEKGKKKTLKYNKWWIYLIIIVGILAIALLAVWLSYRFSKPALGDYVYVDDYNILHVDRSCENIANIHGAKPITVYSLHELESGNWKQVCSSCINDDEYTIIKQRMVGNDNFRRLYDSFVKLGFDMQSYNDFRVDMSDDERLHKLHSILIMAGYDIPPFEKFKIEIGMDSLNPATRNVEYINDATSRVWLYTTLNNEGFNIGTFYEFLFAMDTSEVSRKWCYNKARGLGYNVGKNFKEFDSIIGPKDKN